MNKIKTENFFKYITLFAITGILAIALNNCFAPFVGMFIPKWFISSDNTALLSFFISILIMIFLNGYCYKYAHELFKNDNAQIPEVSLNCFTAFVKMLPVFLLWYIYIFAGVFFGFGLFKLGSLPSICYFAALGVLVIFINTLFILYAKDLQIRKEFFGLNLLKYIISKTFYKIIMTTAKIIFLLIVTGCIIYQIYVHTLIIQSNELYFGTILLVISIGTYIIMLLYLFYIKTLVKILKEETDA